MSARTEQILAVLAKRLNGRPDVDIPLWRLKDAAAAIDAALARRDAEALRDVRRYAELTLDSISVERGGMAEDILSLIDGDE